MRRYIRFRTTEGVEVAINVREIVAVVQADKDHIQILTSTTVVYETLSDLGKIMDLIEDAS